MVDDDALIATMQLLHQHLGLAHEPAGAVSVAAIATAKFVLPIDES